jgi:hypothetical protein
MPFNDKLVQPLFISFVEFVDSHAFATRLVSVIDKLFERSSVSRHVLFRTGELCTLYPLFSVRQHGMLSQNNLLLFTRIFSDVNSPREQISNT